MKLIWTKSKLPLSVLIRNFLGSDCSHFAIVFESRGSGLMFESNLLGTHPRFYKTALKHMEVVHELDIILTIEQENDIWDEIVEKFDGRKYNYKGFLYFCYRAILKKLFKMPLPDKNIFSQPGTYLCDQIFEALGILSKEEIGIDLAMVSPQHLYEYAKDWVLRGHL